MELGLLTLGDHRADPSTGLRTTQAERHRDILEYLDYAEPAGFDAVFVGEHHFSDFITASPPVFLGWLAGRTSTITLGSGVTLLPHHDAVKVAEDFATVDVVSDGRAEVWVGRGVEPYAYTYFGQDVERAVDMQQEGLELLLRLWTETDVTWSGEFRPPLNGVTLQPRPVQEPYIPIKVAVSREESAIAAAELGLGISITMLSFDRNQLAPVVDAYQEVAIETAASGPAAAQLVAAGEGDMGITAWHPLAGMWANGAPFSVVIDGAVLAAAQGKVMVSPDSDMETIADLAGKTVGVGAMGSVFHVALLTGLQDAGIDASTVEVVAVPVTEQIAAVQSGSIDAMLSLEPFTTIGQMQGLKVIADDMFGGRVEQGTSGGLMAMAPWAAENEETIRRARAAWSQVVELMHADEAGFRAFLPTYTALTPELAAVIALSPYRTTTEVANIQPSVDLAAEVGLIAETFDVGPFVAFPEG